MLLEDRCKKIYNLVKKIQDKQYEREYNSLVEMGYKVGTLKEFIDNDKARFNKNEKHDLKDVYILKDNINKGHISVGMYLINYGHTMPITLDKDYKPLPLNKKMLFEYGTVISFVLDDYILDINGMFSGVDESKDNAIDSYKKLKEKIINMSEDELLTAIEKQVLNELNS